MLTCKQVSNALAEGDYTDLPKWKQFMLRLHVALCFVCHKSNGEIMRFQDMIRTFKSKEDALSVGPSLPDNVRQKLHDKIQKQPRKP